MQQKMGKKMESMNEKIQDLERSVVIGALINECVAIVHDQAHSRKRSRDETEIPDLKRKK